MPKHSSRLRLRFDPFYNWTFLSGELSGASDEESSSAKVFKANQNDVIDGRSWRRQAAANLSNWRLLEFQDSQKAMFQVTFQQQKYPNFDLWFAFIRDNSILISKHCFLHFHELTSLIAIFGMTQSLLHFVYFRPFHPTTRMITFYYSLLDVLPRLE